MKTFLNSLFLLAFLLPAVMFGQTPVSGTVTDEANAIPLPGVNILIKGTTTGASTDFDGNYSIQASQGDILVFSYLGYSAKEITFTGQSPLDVSLSEDAGQLDEVVIIGYGTTTKKDATGSIESVTAE
ncbi:carboxypeptidase-like regulatory domain-containing protein, partial [Psychroserpens sp.]